MATTDARQWLRHAAAFAVGFPLLHLPAGTTPVSWECGPGYHKPLFGRCVPDAGVPLLRNSRYATMHSDRHVRSRLPAPLRSMAPWGPNVRG